MSKVDEMFKKLGYDEKHYYKEVELYRNSNKCNCIQFDTFNKTFCKFNEDDSADILDFTIQELQAINEKCKELRMDGGIEYGRHKSRRVCENKKRIYSTNNRN